MDLEESAELANLLSYAEADHGSPEAQRLVLHEALQLFMARNEGKYHDLWKAYGAEDSLQHMKSKLARTKQNFQDTLASDAGALDIDDALDLINYTVFYIRNVLAGRFLSTVED